MTWSARVRTPALQLTDPIEFVQCDLAENFNAAHRLVLSGRFEDLIPTLTPGYGIVVYDGEGRRRFNGMAVTIRRSGDGTAVVTYDSDLQRFWWRAIYPTPAAVWASQTAKTYAVTGTAETRLLDLVKRNLGSLALTVRKLPALRLPTDLTRGPSAITTANPNDYLGNLVAILAELAGLRVDLEQVYVGTTPYLDLTLTPVPDLTSVARIGTAEAGGPIILGNDWYYELGLPTVTAALAAAGDTGTPAKQEMVASPVSPWGYRIEQVVDMSGTTDTGEISEGLATALAEGLSPTELSLPIGDSDLELGTEVPLGALAAATLDGQVFTERIRQINTTLSVGSDGPTESVTAVMGSPVAGLSASAALLTQMLRRIRKVEART